MAGIYIHIPFCQSKCRYCDFTSFSGCDSLMPAYINSLTAEMQKHAGKTFDTVYIGGGTPSCLPPALLETLLAAMHTHFSFVPDAEMSCEMNPGTVTEAFLQALKRAGFNRVSMGMQAKSPALLQTLGRAHQFEQVVESVALCRAAGFTNINIDLMLGIPGQTMRDAQEALDAAIALGATHISCYGLIVEENTPLETDIRTGRLSLPDEEKERTMYTMAIERLAAAGLVQYEISNFAKPGLECRHNIGYWKRAPYLGLGVSAHSFENEIRTANTTSLQDYLKGITVLECEEISPEEAHFETLMLGLRMNEGVPFEPRDEQKARPLIEQGLLRLQDGRLQLTSKGMDVQNTVLLNWL